MRTGSSDFAPISNATSGQVGVAITSQPRNAASKSRRRSVRTCCALR